MLRTRIEKLLSFGAPISRATLPLVNGLARQRLLRGGAQQCEARVHGLPINYYYQAPAQTAASL